jgi:hypothetical protein
MSVPWRILAAFGCMGVQVCYGRHIVRIGTTVNFREVHVSHGTKFSRSTNFLQFGRAEHSAEMNFMD